MSHSQSQMLSHSRITGVRFSMIGSDEIIKESCVPIKSADLLRQDVPYEEGLCDPRTGTVDHGYKCQTCHHNKRYCLGHPGHYNLNYPVISPMALGETRKWLKLICFNCARPIIHDSQWNRFTGKKRLDEAQKIARTGNKRCVNPDCKTVHPTISKDKLEPLMVYASYNEDPNPKTVTRKEIIYPHMILALFNRIADSTVISLGKSVSSHPRNFVTTVIKIPPITVRPDVKKMGGGKMANDDITAILQVIIRKSEMLPTTLPEQIDEKTKRAIYELNNACYDMIKANKENSVNSYSLRIKGKTGQPRNHMMGKRVFGMCRAVIVGDVDLRIEQVGLPLVFACTLQRKETVQEFNKVRLMRYVNNGRHSYPGCTKVVKKSTGIEYSGSNIMNLEIENGDSIYRDLIDGDAIGLTRQPSLKPSSNTTMSIKVYLDPLKLAFGINVLIVKGYFDGDFDGDEMGGPVYGVISTVNETLMLSSPPNWFISHSNSCPIVGQVEDGIMGTYELTKASVRLNKYHALLLFGKTIHLPPINEQEITGRDVISKLLEPTPINFTRTPTYYNKALAAYMDYDPRDIKVKIDHGRLVSGVLDKASVGGGGNGGLYHVVGNKYGNQAALDLMFDMQQTAIGFLYQHGHTIGIKDLVLSPEANKEIDQIAQNILLKSRLVTDQLNEQNIVPPIGMTVEQYYEAQQVNVLKVFDDFLDPVMSSINPKINGLFKLIIVGSKGAMPNLFNMVSAVGPKLINGERIKQKFGYKRTLSFFPRFATSAESRGYIASSYIKGLNSDEYFFNAMNSRFDFISVALNTSVTGEQMRKSIKNLESLITNNHRMSMKANNIVQLVYGEDYLDPRAVERVTFPTVMLGDKEFAAEYGPAGPFFDALSADRARYRDIFLRVEDMNISEVMSNERSMPVNVARIVEDITRANPTAVKGDLAEMIAHVDSMCKGIPYVLINEIQEKAQTPVPEYIREACWLLTMLIRSYLYPKVLEKMNMTVLQLITDEIRLVYSKSLIEYGTAVGIIAAQSFSQPLTQYMLDSKHRSASGGTSKSGMTQAKEVMAARDVDKLVSPSMFLRVLPEYETDHGRVQEIANNIEVMRLRQFATIVQVFFEKYGEPVHPKYAPEAAFIKEFVSMNPLLAPPGDLVRWCIRMEINKTSLILKNMSMEIIINRLRDVFPDLYIVYTPENAMNIVIRVYMQNSMKDAKGNLVFKGLINTEQINDIRDEIVGTIIRGVDGIISTTVSKVARSRIADDGAIVRADNMWAITTVGTNFVGLMNNKFIDTPKIQTDAIIEVYRTLGIEAARQKLISELRNLVGCNHRHYLMYADEMTFTGRVTSIERTGLSNREATNWLLRIGFGTPIQVLEEAGINAALDEVTGVTAPLMLGSIPLIGTLYNKFQVNGEMVKNNVKRADDYLDLL